jgi:hypothetical protein
MFGRFNRAVYIDFVRKFTLLLFLAFGLHLLVSLTFIVLPSLVQETRVSKIYKTYLLPGPFFSEDRIVNSYILSVSWKIRGKWSIPINPVKEGFIRYHQNFNPAQLYASRFERSLYQELVFDRTPTSAQLDKMKSYFRQYAPYDSDSIRFVITRRHAENFTVKVDTLYILDRK